MSDVSPRHVLLLVLAAAVALAAGHSRAPLQAQGSTAGEWRFYGADAASTKYSPLDEITAENVAKLTIAWRWKAENFGPRPEFNWEVTPLVAGGRLFVTAGVRRQAVAIDPMTGETLWAFRLDEGERGAVAARVPNRGLAYWTDGRGDERILLITPGFQLVALNAKNGQRIDAFGRTGIVDLTDGLDRDPVRPGSVGSSSPAIVVNDVIVVGAAAENGTAPISKTNTPGYIRGYDVRTGRRLWTFHTIPRPGQFGHETWENDSWKYTGNTGAWAPLSADPQLGYVYIPVETPTGDFYGGNRHGNNLFADSLVCLDAKTGRRVWHFQFVHHGVWDYDISSPPILMDVTVAGRPIKAVAQVTKQGWVYFFDRVTGTPVWPIEERPVPQSNVPGEKTAPSQPHPTRPAPYERQGFSLDDVISLTPDLHKKALAMLPKYKLGPLFTPPVVYDENGVQGVLMMPETQGGANWPGGAIDRETGLLFVASGTNPFVLAVAPVTPPRSDMGYVGRQVTRSVIAPNGQKVNFGPENLPLVNPPWGRITAIDMNTGDHAWMKANGSAPDYIRNHPALKGVDLSQAGRPERALLMVTKTLLFAGEGSGLFSAAPGAGGTKFRAYDKKTGAVVHERDLPASMTGVPMTYLAQGQQFIAFPIGGIGHPAELIALKLP